MWKHYVNWLIVSNSSHDNSNDECAKRLVSCNLVTLRHQLMLYSVNIMYIFANVLFKDINWYSVLSLDYVYFANVGSVANFVA